MRKDIFAQQAALLFGAVPRALAFNIINAAVLLFMFQGVAEGARMWAWAGAFVFVIVARAALFAVYQSRKPEGDAVTPWVRGMVALLAVTGVVWGAAAWVFTSAVDVEFQLLTVLVLIMLATGAMVGLYPVLAAFLAFVTPMMALLFMHGLLMETPLHLVMAVLEAVLLVFLIYSAKRQRDELIKSLLLRRENQHLLSRAQRETQEVRHENQDMARMETLLRQKTLVLDAVSKIQGLFITNRDARDLFDRTLEVILDLTSSPIGFIGEVHVAEDGHRYLKTFSVSNIAWDDESRRFYEDNAAAGLEFHNHENLFGHVLKTGEPVIANDPASDPRAGGMPDGHPPVEAFLGIPLYVGDDMIGMFAVANREGGYPIELVTALEPVISAMANMMDAVHNRRERLDAEFEASQAMERLTTAIESLNDGFVIFDSDDRLVLCNSKYKKMYAETADMMVPGTPFEDILRAGVRAGQFAGADAEHIEEWVQNRMALHRRKSSLIEQRLSNGTWLRAEERETPDGGRVGFRVDITEMKAAQEKLRKSEEKFRSIVQSTAEGYWLIDPESKQTLEVNDALCAMLGYAPEEMLGKRPVEFCDEANAQIFREQTAKISTTAHRSYDITLKHKDGHDVPSYFSATTLHDDDGAPTTAYAFVTDMSEQKRIQCELEKAVVEVEKASRAKTEFLSSMSHELRTPMNAVLGFAQLLQMNPQVPLHPRQADSVEQILKAGNHLLELINEILDLSRIESGRINLSLEDIDPREVVEECLTYIQPLAAKRSIAVDADIPAAHEFTIHTDRTRFKQVLLNLLSNAVKYNVEKGQVTLSIRTGGAGFVEFSVADTGPGIPEDKQEAIFEPFSRLGAETTDIEGTGIGLTISRKLAKLMGGELNFESVLGQGSKFWIDLPGSARSGGALLATGDTDKSFPELAGDGHTVLYVEDNPDNLTLMEHVVSMLDGVELISAHTGELGLEMAEIHRPGVILMDINLPGINGIEALNRLRARDETRFIPVIAISADAMPADIKRGLDAGFDAYLTKPINLVEVVDHLKRALEGELGPKVPVH